MTITGTTHVADGSDGKVRNYTIEPEDVGLTRAGIDEICGGKTAKESAQQVRTVLAGEKGPRLDMVLLNSGASLLAAGKADTIGDGVVQARKIVKSGAALDKLDRLIGFS
jgi:anthranilate phosphoribosyltransferase